MSAAFGPLFRALRKKLLARNLFAGNLFRKRTFAAFPRLKPNFCFLLNQNLLQKKAYFFLNSDSAKNKNVFAAFRGFQRKAKMLVSRWLWGV